MKNTDYKIYCDADGTLVGFDAKVFQIFGKYAHEFEKHKFWAEITKYDKNIEKFFRNLPKMEDADILINFLVENFEFIKILTATGDTPKDAKEQKIEWFAEHYPTLECLCVKKSPDKAIYACPKSILIDDREKSIKPWVEAGGIGILHTSAEDTIRQLKQILNSST